MTDDEWAAYRAAARKQAIEEAVKVGKQRRYASAHQQFTYGPGTSPAGALALAAPFVDQFVRPDRRAAVGNAAGKFATAIGRDVARLAKPAGEYLHDLFFLSEDQARAPLARRPPSGREVSQALRAVPAAGLSALRAAPNVVGQVARAVPGFAYELTGIPSLERAELAAQRADAAEAGGEDPGRAGLAAIGETLGGLSSVSLAPGAGSAARGGVTAGAGVVRALTRPKPKNSGRKPPISSSNIAGLALAAGGGLALAASGGEAQAQGAEPATAGAVEDAYVNFQGRGVPRPNAAAASSAGFAQGLSLNSLDDLMRKRQLKPLLEAARTRVQQNPADPEAFARLAQLEQEYDPIAWHARTNGDAFRSAKTTGELTTGFGTAIASGLAGLALKRPALVNAATGGIKGAVYGAGADEGEVPADQRLTRGLSDAAFASAISAGAGPVSKQAGYYADNSPIYARQLSNSLARLGGKQPRPAAETTSRFSAPTRADLKPGAKAVGVVRQAQAADGLSYPRTKYGKRETELRDLARSQPEGQKILALWQSKQQRALVTDAARAKFPQITKPSGRAPTSEEYVALRRHALAPKQSAQAHAAWAADAKKLPQEQKSWLAYQILEDAKSAPLEALQRPEVAAKLRALSKHRSKVLITPQQVARLQLGETRPLLGLGRSGLPKTATPKTAEALAKALTRGGSAPIIPGDDLSSSFQRVRDRGFGDPGKTPDWVQYGAYPLGVGLAVPATGQFNSLLEHFGAIKPVDQGAEPAAAQTDLLRALAGTELQRETAGVEGQIQELEADAEATLQRQMRSLTQQRAHLSAALRRAEAQSRRQTGPEGQDWSGRARRAGAEASSLRKQLDALPSPETLARQNRSALERAAKNLRAQEQRLSQREQLLAEPAGR